MDESATPAPATPVRRPRFPWLGALLCAAAVGAAAWMWMRYSYRWDATPSDIGLALGRYVRVPGRLRPATRRRMYRQEGLEMLRLALSGDECSIVVHVPPNGRRRQTRRFEGRVRWVSDVPDGMIIHSSIALDTTASRFHPASIGGLIVGAMGCFIFGLYLRAWLRERRAAA